MFVPYSVSYKIRQIFLTVDFSQSNPLIQCKICGTPLGKDPSTEELETHWKKHHSWHWEKNQEKTPEEALLKKR